MPIEIQINWSNFTKLNFYGINNIEEIYWVVTGQKLIKFFDFIKNSRFRVR